jgi:hypothetical protein
LWVDTVARALRDIEHRYVGLDRRIESMRPGGHISFREMANGVVMIDRWSLRLIGGQSDTVRPPPFTQGRQLQVPPPQIRLTLRAAENGGEVARARWPDGSAWHASLGTLRLHAVTSDGRPAVGAAVHLVETQYRATVDSNGDAVIADLIPGPYSLGIKDRRLALLGLEIRAPVQFVAERDSTVRQSLVVATTEDFVVGRCAASRRYTPSDSVMLLGRALTPDGMPVSGLTIALIPQVGAVNKPLSDTYDTGTDGLFQFCGRGLQPGMSIRIEASRDGALVSATSVVLSDNLTVVRLGIASGR